MNTKPCGGLSVGSTRCRPARCYRRSITFGWWYAGFDQNGDGSADMVLAATEYRQTFRTPTCHHGPFTYGPGEFDNPCSIFHFGSPHRDGAHLLFAGGPVRRLDDSIGPRLNDLTTREGGTTGAIP